MTKSKTETALQVSGAIQNTMTILARRVQERGGNLTGALVRLGQGEAWYENSINLIAGELAAMSRVSGTPKKKPGIVAPEGGRVHIVHIPDDLDAWNASLDAGFPNTRQNSDVREVGNQYPSKSLTIPTKHKTILVNFGNDIPNVEVALAWGEEQKLIPVSPRLVWALGRYRPQLNAELGQKALVLVSLKQCMFLGDWRVLCGRWEGDKREAGLMWPDDYFDGDFCWFAFEEAPSV